jgi:hypothetical protein
MSEGLGRSVGMPNMGQIEEEEDDDAASSHGGSQKQEHKMNPSGSNDHSNYAEVAVSRHSINEGDEQPKH